MQPCPCCCLSASQPLGAQLPSLQPGDGAVRPQGCWDQFETIKQSTFTGGSLSHVFSQWPV